MQNSTLSALVAVGSETAYGKRLSTLNKRLNKYNIQVTETNRETILVDGVAVNKIDLTLPVVKTGYTPVGTIINKEGVLSLFSTNNVPLKDFTDITENACSVCGKTHSKRTKMFIFKKDNKLVSVGSSCSTNYVDYNISSVYKLLSSFSAEYNEEAFTEQRYNGGIFIDVDDILLSCVRCNKIESGYVANNVTIERVKEVIKTSKKATKSELAEIENIKTAMKTMFCDNVDSNDNFLYSFKETLYIGNNLVNAISVRGIGRVIYAVYATITKMNTKPAVISTYIGKVGEVLKVNNFNVIEVKSYTTNSFSYYGTTSYLVKGQDENGNHISFFTTSNKVLDKIDETKTFNISGNVVEHKEFGKQKVTCMKRVKLIK